MADEAARNAVPNRNFRIGCLHDDFLGWAGATSLLKIVQLGLEFDF
jgi:hypothetical protein